MSRFILCAALCAAAIAAAAQAPRPDPLDHRAAVPPASYRSALTSYRNAASAAASAIGWKQANDEVARIGGWRAYARESAASAPATPAHKH
jgi:hypothetical protein